ncbi:MAG TPA: hypothetical protein VML50_16280 [Anaeromyxobacter sp.]|nr:hypothetical protein [Anaeromyxobacter sp.]
MRPQRAALALLALAACSRGDEAARSRLLARDERRPAPAAYDAAHPEATLGLGAGEAARRLGSFEWTAGVEWSVSREGADAQRVRAVERHTLRQSADGAFQLGSEIDPGLGPGSETGRDVVWVQGMTYARSRPAPWRERPTDRGRDAARFRDETFGLLSQIAALYGPALRLQPAGDASVLGRPAHRYRFALERAASPPAPAGPPPGPPPDPDTARRLAFLGGLIPLSAEGEVLEDAETGVPLRARLSSAFGSSSLPAVRTTLELSTQVKAFGDKVPAVAAPPKARPDERKPAGPSTALEAAGLKKRGEKPGESEPSDEGE